MLAGPLLNFMASISEVGDRVRFEVARAKEFPGKDYNFVTFFDCLHDMGDPKGAAAHVREAIKSTGTWMIVEQFAGDKREDNFNPAGRALYSASTLICTPASLSQEVGAACLHETSAERQVGVLKRLAAPIVKAHRKKLDSHGNSHRGFYGPSTCLR